MARTWPMHLEISWRGSWESPPQDHADWLKQSRLLQRQSSLTRQQAIFWLVRPTQPRVERHDDQDAWRRAPANVTAAAIPKKVLRLRGLRPLRRCILGLFLERFPNGVVTNKPFFVRRFLTSHKKTCFALRHFRPGFRLSTHTSPLYLAFETCIARIRNRIPCGFTAVDRSRVL